MQLSYMISWKKNFPQQMGQKIIEGEAKKN